MADELRTRGLPDWRATLLAQITTAALGHAIHTRVADPSSNVDDLIVRVFTDLRSFCDVNA